MKKLFLTLTLVLFVIQFGKSQDLPSYIPTNGLVAYYPFNGNANDVSGNGYHGTVNGATLTTDRNNNADNAYVFDNSNIEIPHQFYSNGWNDYTINLWFLTSDKTVSSQAILNTIPHDGEGLNFNHPHHINVFSHYKSSDLNIDNWDIWSGNEFSINVENNIWYMISIVKHNDEYKYYINNQLISSSINALSAQNQLTGFTIGSITQENNNQENLLGKLDDIGFWNKALSQEEMQNLYASSTGDILLNGTVSAENNQIKNLEDPTHPQDAVTKNYTYSKTEVDALISEIKTELGNQIDNDGDGYSEDGGDCNDSDSEINPAANEVCDNIDNNCNSEIDEGVTNPYYQDVDGDGFGLNGIDPVMSCSPPEDYVSNNQDCDDSNAAVYPGAPEISDGIDNDCDGQIDEQNEPTLVSGHEDSSTFSATHSSNYSTVISHVNEVSQLLSPNTKITKLIIHPYESKNNVKVIPFLTDENFNVIALGEEYYFDAAVGESHEIIFNTELTSTSSFYIGCYENVITKHLSNSCNGKYKWESGEPSIGLTIDDGTSSSNSCRSTQAYGY